MSAEFIYIYIYMTRSIYCWSLPFTLKLFRGKLPGKLPGGSFQWLLGSFWGKLPEGLSCVVEVRVGPLRPVWNLPVGASELDFIRGPVGKVGE